MDGAQEGVSLFKIVVTILLVLLVIGAIVGLTYAAYSWFNSGTQKLTDQVASIDKSAFSQYDDQTVKGVDVLSALKTYRESEIGVFIANKQLNGNTWANLQNTSIKALNYCALAENSAASSAAAGCQEVQVDYDNAGGSGTLANCYTISSLKWDTTSGLLQSNTNFSPTTTKANTAAYVNQNADWYAKLVYDESTNDICGILFVQMN